MAETAGPPAADPPSSSPVDELVLTAAARSLRRAVGPTAWVVLEELTSQGSPASDDVVVVSTNLRSLAEALGLGRDAVAGALQALALAGWVRSEAARSSGGRFGAGRYLVSSNAALRPASAASAAPAAPATRRQRAVISTPPPSPCPEQLSLLDLSSAATVSPRPPATTAP